MFECGAPVVRLYYFKEFIIIVSSFAVRELCNPSHSFYICTCCCTRRILRGSHETAKKTQKKQQDSGQNSNPHTALECAVVFFFSAEEH